MILGKFVQNLHKISQKTAANRLQTYCSSQYVQIQDHNEKNFQPRFKNLVMILIVSPNFYQSLKFFFNWELSAPLLEGIYKKDISNGEKEHLTVDMFKEISNLSAGHIKTVLSKSEIYSDISLPISMRGYDDLFFNQSNNLKQSTQSWKFQIGTSSLIFSSAIEARGELDDHQIISEGIEDSDDSIEFF